jgi:tripartite-type tricarboxylate transporter receptor subunit TctC
LISGFAPGGSTDIACRLISERFAHHIGGGARVVVENRPGASGTVAADWLRRQSPDGHTIMLVEVSSHAIAPAALQGGTPFDPVGDFTQIGMVGTAPMVFITSPRFPANTAVEAIARLRAAPRDTYTYATSGVGSIPQLGAEMIGLRLNTRFTHLPYRSGGLMLTSIYQDEGNFGVSVLASAAAQIRDGMVKGLAVTSRERFPAFPDIPTLAEAALPDFELTTWNMIIGPPRMPPAILARLNAALNLATAERALAERFLTAGVVMWNRPNTPDTTRAFLQSEVEKYRDLVARTGVRLER